MWWLGAKSSRERERRGREGDSAQKSQITSLGETVSRPPPSHREEPWTPALNEQVEGDRYQGVAVFEKCKVPPWGAPCL